MDSLNSRKELTKTKLHRSTASWGAQKLDSNKEFLSYDSEDKTFSRRNRYKQPVNKMFKSFYVKDQEAREKRPIFKNSIEIFDHSFNNSRYSHNL